jgi:hypothetical protein
MVKKKEETATGTPTEETTATDTATAETNVEETLVNVLVLESHACEIAGKRLDMKKGAKIQITPFQFQVLSNPNLNQKIVQAI